MKKTVSLLLILTMFFAVPFSSAASAGAFLIMDGRTQTVLEERNGEVALPMASTTKIMTALLVLEQVSRRRLSKFLKRQSV